MATSTKNATDISPVSSFSNYSPKSYISPAPATSAKSYVVYSSHSGFNNQRSSLENAIRIALRLNATLVLPFAQLGTMAFPWKPFDKLFGQVNKLNDWCLFGKRSKGIKTHLITCSNFVDLLSFEKLERQFPAFHYMSFGDFLTETKVYDIAEQSSVKAIWEKLETTHQILRLKDYERYAYKFYDSAKGQTPGEIPLNELYLEPLDLQLHKVNPITTKNLQFERLNPSSKDKIYHFGSLYEKHRIFVPEKDWQEDLQIVNNLYPSNPELEATANNVAAKLGGIGTYISIHARITESFKYRVGSRMSEAIEMVKSCASNSPGCNLSRMGTLGATNITLKSCTVNSSNPFTIFLATDYRMRPESHADLYRLYTQFPCIYQQQDFQQEIHLEANLSIQKNKVKNLLPILDQMILAKGHVVLQTKQSTFSEYTEVLHKIYSRYI